MKKHQKYPRIKQKTKINYNKRGKGICKICGEPSRGRVDVQVNWFRGDDDVLKVCQNCQKIYTNFGLLVKLGYKEIPIRKLT